MIDAYLVGARGLQGRKEREQAMTLGLTRWSGWCHLPFRWEEEMGVAPGTLLNPAAWVPGPFVLVLTCWSCIDQGLFIDIID